MVERIMNKDNLLALIIRIGFSKNGVHFFTPDEFSQQVASKKDHVESHNFWRVCAEEVVTGKQPDNDTWCVCCLGIGG